MSFRVFRGQNLALFSVSLYGCGLCIGEALALEVRDGKGGKQRYVPLPKAIYLELRAHWATHRNKRFLFPALGSAWRANRRASEAEQAVALGEAMDYLARYVQKTALDGARILASDRVKGPESPHAAVPARGVTFSPNAAIGGPKARFYTSLGQRPR